MANVQYVWKDGDKGMPDILSVLFGVCTQVVPNLVKKKKTVKETFSWCTFQLYLEQMNSLSRWF